MRRPLPVFCALIALLPIGSSQAHGAPVFLRPRFSSARSRRSFDFYSLRVKERDEENAPSVSRVRSGQTFYISLDARTLRAMDTRVGFEWEIIGPAGRVCGSRGEPSFVDMPAGTDAGHTSGWCRLTLHPGLQERTFKVLGSVTMNGVRQTRSTWLTVYR